MRDNIRDELHLKKADDSIKGRFSLIGMVVETVTRDSMLDCPPSKVDWERVKWRQPAHSAQERRVKRQRLFWRQNRQRKERLRPEPTELEGGGSWKLQRWCDLARPSWSLVQCPLHVRKVTVPDKHITWHDLTRDVLMNYQFDNIKSWVT